MNSRRTASLFLTLLTLLFLTAACDSTTSLDEVSLVGTWDGVGSLQTVETGQGLTLFIQSHGGGSISGTWTKNQGVAGLGSISSGAAQNEEIRFTLQGYPGDDPTFIGGLTDQHRMSGDMDVAQIDGSAVFRRRSVAAP